MANVAETLGRLTALDADARPIPLGDLWRERPVVVVFVRHFG